MVEPWNSSLIWRSKSTRRGLFGLSPMGFLCRFGRKSSGTLGFPGERRKRHAETTEPSGKSGVTEPRRVQRLVRQMKGLPGDHPAEEASSAGASPSASPEKKAP